MRRTAFVASLAAAAAAARVPAGAQEAGNVIRIASAVDDDVTPVLWADKAGWFREAGLTVKIDKLNTGAAIAAAVAGGSIDIGKVSPLAIILAHSKGVPLTIVAPGGMSSPDNVTSGLLVLKDSPYRSAKDLTGKIVSVPALNDLQSLAAHAWIDKNGGDSKSVQFIEAPVTAVAIALDSNRIAAGTITNPVMGQLMASGRYRSIAHTVDGIAPRIMISFWVADTGWVAKNPAAVEKFGEVVARSIPYVNAHHDQTVDLQAQWASVDPANVRTMVRAAFPDRLDAALMQPIIDVAAKYGAIKAPFPANELFSSNAYVPKR